MVLHQGMFSFRRDIDVKNLAHYFILYECIV